jgi:outer membrane protein OmpA-like peptidoglycan-associated protein
MTGSASRIGIRNVVRRSALTLLFLIVAGIPVHAQEKPSLKEILGRAQSDSERKAVEDLIGKLQAKPAQPGQAAPEAAKPPLPTVAPKQSPERQADDDKREKSPTTTSPQSPAEQPGITAKPSAPAEGDQSATAAKPSSDVPPVASDERPPPEVPKVVVKPAAEQADAILEKAERQQLPSVELEVQFEYNSAKLTPAAVETLTTLGSALINERLAGSPFLIGGHTDAKGSADYNLRLSDRRAEAVRQFLITTFGIDASRLSAKGFGSRYLKNPRQPRAAENRRVQVVNVSRQEAQ